MAILERKFRKKLGDFVKALDLDHAMDGEVMLALRENHRPTAEYLNYVLTRLTAPGSLYLAVIGLIPAVAFALMGVSNQIPFGGTSLLIMVGVGLDTVKQIESQLQQRNYEGFLR